MKIPLTFFLIGLFSILFAQTHEKVTFRHEATLASGAVFVSGNLPELGLDDLGKSIQLLEVDTDIWEVDVSLPVNRSYDYRFYSRSINTRQTADPAHGTPLTDSIAATTSTVVLDPANKELSYRGALTSPVLNWRQDSAAGFTALPLNTDGNWQVSGTFAESNRSLEFFFTGDTGREPAGEETYATSMEMIFVQGGELFTYEPAETVSLPRRDYDPNDLPVISSGILNQDRSYRVLLPRGYDDHPNRYYPVVYCLNGQQLFEADTTIFGRVNNPQPPLDLDGATISGVIASGQMHEVIVVGVDILAFNEVSFANEPYQNDGQPGLYKGFADFMRLELMPVINEQYRTLAGAENTATFGFGFGASVALYYAWDYPNRFGKTGLLSMGNRPGLMNVIALDTKRDIKIYLDSSNSGFSQLRDLRSSLLGKQGSRFVVEGDLRYRFEPDQSEDVDGYRTRLPDMLSFLFPTSEPLDASAARAANPYWLSFYGLTTTDWDLDGDGDGWSTRQEYRFGTNPTSASSFPQYSFSAASDEFAFDFQSVPGVRYQLEESPNLIDWDTLGDFVSGTGQEFTGLIPFDGDSPAKSFFRLSVVDPIDTDLDGLTDIEEGALLGTKIGETDTDRDGFPDGDEVLFLGTDPLVPNVTGGSISGRVINDVNGDGDLTGESSISGVTVFLDLNYDGVFDANEPFQMTDSNGVYRFEGVAPGSYHLRQIIPPANVQTVPGRLPGQPDGLPDRVVSLDYVPVAEAPTLYGNFAVDDHGVPTPISPSRPREPVTADITLKPIGDRARAFALGLFNTTEFVALTKDSVLTVAFDDEEIIDGPGFDFQIVSLDNVQDAGEKVEVFVGSSLDEMVFLTVANEAGATGIDLARYGIDDPIRYVRLRSLNSNGSSPGYDFVGFEAINFAPISTDAHLVEVSSDESVEDVDFGRFGRDLPPHVFLSNESPTPLAGGSVSVRISGSDDFDTPTLSLTANGVAAALDAEGRVTVPTPFPGEMILVASAADSTGQTSTKTLILPVLNADGSPPNVPNSPTLEDLAEGAPRIVIHSPGAGDSVDVDTSLVASVTDENLTSWKLHYAPIDDIDPYNLSAMDPDYVLLNEGTESVVNGPLGTIPATTLADGIYFVRVSATANGITGFSGHVIAVRTDPSELYPEIMITSPEANSLVTYLTDVVGSISSNRPLREWYVEYTDVNGINLQNLADTSRANLVRLAEGTDELDGTLATFDPTLLQNGTYFLKVTAWNDLGLGWTEGVVVNVCGENKPGRLRVEFEDLEIDLVGIPIQIRRIYDSLDREAIGDFGHGWSMAMADPDIRNTDPDGGTPISTSAWQVGTRIYLNAPSGERIGFTFGIEKASSGFIGTNFRATFTPDPGVYETLSVPEGDTGFLAQAPDGSVVLSFIALPYNPDVFILTTKDGTKYTYDENLGLLDVEDMAGNTLIFTEDGIRHTSGASVDFVRDDIGRITSITGPDGAAWTYSYDLAGDLVEVNDPTSAMTKLSYTEHYLETITDPLGRTGVRYEYDDDGRLSAVIDEDGNRSERSWDLEGFSGTQSDLRGNVTTIRYDERGNVLREELPNGAMVVRAYEDDLNPDLETSITDGLGNKTNFKSDERGNMTQVTPPIGKDTKATYNDLNLPILFSTPNLQTHDFVYNERGELTEHQFTGSQIRRFTHTADGRVSSYTDISGNQNFMRYGGLYGKLDRLENANGSSTGATYLPNGLLEMVEGNFGETSFTYDDSGRILTETDALGNVITYTHNGDQIASSVDETGVTRTYTFDTQDRMLTRTIDGEEVVFTYDADGNRTSITDPLGNVTTMTYDSVGNLETTTDPAGEVTTHQYDFAGNRVETVDRLGRKRTFVYDAMNRLTHERWHDAGDDTVIREIIFGYNSQQRLKTVTDGDIVYGFSSLGTEQISNMSVTYPGLPEQNFAYAYEDRSRLTSTTLEIKKYHQINRDSVGNPTQMILRTPDSDVTARVDLLRNSGKLPREILRYNAFNAPAGSLVSTTEFLYNHRGRPSTITHRDATSTIYPDRGALSYTHNPRGQVASLTEGATTTNVSYNARGEIDGSYSFDAGSNPSGATLSAGNRLEAIGDFEFDWDAEGNLVQRRNVVSGEVFDLTWDYRNRLIRVEIRPSAGAAPTSTVDYQYDYRDLQIARTENSVTVWTLYTQDDMPFAELTGTDATPTAIFYYDPDRTDRFLGEWRAGKGMRWFLTDQLGSIRSVTDADGNIVATADFDAFGKIIASTGDGSSLGFAGRYHDPTTGFIYNRARHYDPEIGRFLSEDPIGHESGEINLYRYAKNDPYNLVDPSGTTSAIEYGVMLVEIVDAICYAAGVGQKLDECYTGIAKVLEDPYGNSGSASCTSNFPLAGPLPYPVPSFGDVAARAAGGGGGGGGGAGGGGSGGGGGGSSGGQSCPSAL